MRDSSGRELIVISGSTLGLGNGYGNAAGDDDDGFLTILDPSSGERCRDRTYQQHTTTDRPILTTK
jgi:hypothetical protein